MVKARVGFVIPKEWKTIDEVVAGNLQQIRKKREIGVTELARSLGVGRAVIYDMEGSAEGRKQRNKRAQREFRLSDLMALCGALDTTLFELVLPEEGQKVRDLHQLPGMFPDEPDPDRQGPPFQTYGRDGLAQRLFGLPVEWANEANLAQLARGLEPARKARDEQIQKATSDYLNSVLEIARQFIEAQEEE